MKKTNENLYVLKTFFEKAFDLGLKISLIAGAAALGTAGIIDLKERKKNN